MSAPIPLALDWLGRSRTVFVEVGEPVDMPAGGLGLLADDGRWWPLLRVELADGRDICGELRAVGVGQIAAQLRLGQDGSARGMP